MNRETPKIICFEEVLWDLLPKSKARGGAPMNVAYHAQLGIPAQMINSLGKDTLKKNLILFLSKKGTDTMLMQTDSTFPTAVT